MTLTVTRVFFNEMRSTFMTYGGVIAGVHLLDTRTELPKSVKDPLRCSQILLPSYGHLTVLTILLVFPYQLRYIQFMQSIQYI